MRRHLTFLVLVSALGVSGAASADPILAYIESIGTDTVANTTHNGPSTYRIETANTSHAYAWSSITFSSSPAPYVQASAENWIDDPRQWNPSGAIGGSMLYQMAVHGTPNTLVPVGYDGQFSVSGTYLNAARAEVWPQTSASVTMVIGQNYFKLECGLGICDKTVAGVTEWDTAVGADLYSGWISGRTGISLNESGTGIVTIILAAQALAHTGFVGIASANAFIDPKFYIDPDYLAANPGTALAFTPGVGNDIAAVPEPASGWLILLGLGLLGRTGRLRSKLRPQMDQTISQQ